jgi:hypothetical protein
LGSFSSLKSKIRDVAASGGIWRHRLKGGGCRWDDAFVLERLLPRQRLDKLHRPFNPLAQLLIRFDALGFYHMVMENKETGHQVTFGVWSKDVLTLLPHTDKIAFVQDGKDPVMADWNRAVTVVGDLLKPMDVHPERFRVSEFPTEEQLAAMGATKP